MRFDDIPARASALAAVLMFSASWCAASAYTLKTLHSFCAEASCTDGRSPQSPLILDQSGNLYGMTEFGGAHDSGTVFELSPSHHNKWKIRVLHDFCSQGGCADGANPILGGLIADTAGDLYGVTPAGGATNNGTAFELIPNAKHTKWKLKVLHAFCTSGGASCTDGSAPQATLSYTGSSTGVAYDGVSPLYGTAANGGANGKGVAFELVPHKHDWRETVLYDFCSEGGGDCTDGATPFAAMTPDAAGNLYGTTIDGTQHRSGVVFELVPNAHRTEWTETVLYHFCPVGPCADGIEPVGITMDASGDIFGTTLLGGIDPGCPGDDCGVLFKLVPNGTSSQETALHDFCSLTDCADGKHPWGTLMMDDSGKLFGTTFYGGGHDGDPEGKGAGTVFQFKGSQKVLYSFCALASCIDGAYPRGGLIEDSSGTLYGTTGSDGANGHGGTIYELKP